jgi:hypothetical protein
MFAIYLGLATLQAPWAVLLAALCRQTLKPSGRLFSVDLHDLGRKEEQSPLSRFRNESFLGQQDRQSLPYQNNRFTVHEWNNPRRVFVIEYMGRLPIPNSGEFVAVLTAKWSRLPLSNHHDGNQPKAWFGSGNVRSSTTSVGGGGWGQQSGLIVSKGMRLLLQRGSFS